MPNHRQSGTRLDLRKYQKVAILVHTLKEETEKHSDSNKE